MMTLKNLATLSLLTAVAGACDVKQDLGDTATTGESSSGSAGDGSGGTTGGDTGVLDTGPGDDTGLTEGTSTGSSDTGVLDTGPWDDTGDETGEPDMCDGSAPMVDWDPSGLAPEALGFGGAFVGVGFCETSMGEVLNVPKDSGEGTVATLALTCTLSGSRDTIDFVDENISIDIELSSAGDLAPLLPGFSSPVNARFVVESNGLEQGRSRYVVLTQPMEPGDGDAPVLIATDASGVEPNGSAYLSWYEGDWFGGPSVAPVDASCATGNAPSCGFDVALQAGWLDRSPPEVHGGQSAQFLAPTEAGTYDIFVETAWQAPQAFECGEDFPSSTYSFVALGATSP